MKKLIFVSVLLVLQACASSSMLMTGDKRDPVEPAQVELYTSFPSGATEIARINANSEGGFTAQGRQDSVIEELKERAASIGANGIVLLNNGTTTGNNAVGVSSTGQVMVIGGARTVYASAIAVYVQPSKE